MDFGPDPVHRKGDESHTYARIEALDRLHQSDVALLNQIGLGETVSVIAPGDADDES